ncbi:hypothetical protein MMC28_002101 [Mycoblastus sanguinarius]|nr:hypothetical protein [Mycoblastus sanguinarius]
MPYWISSPPCSIVLLSYIPRQQDQTTLSLVDIVGIAREILETCHSFNKGGVNNFAGFWAISVAAYSPNPCVSLGSGTTSPGNCTTPTTSQVVKLIATSDATTASENGLVLNRTQPEIITNNPSNAIGCYNLLPETVDLKSCQPTFDQLQKRPGASDQRLWGSSGVRLFYFGSPPCNIVLRSTTQGLSTVPLSVIDVVSFAAEVLDTCRVISTGGFNHFWDTWRVEVSRDRIQAGSSVGEVAYE